MFIKENFNDGEEKDESKDETAVVRAQTPALINENVSDEGKDKFQDDTVMICAQTAVEIHGSISDLIEENLNDEVMNAFQTDPVVVRAQSPALDSTEKSSAPFPDDIMDQDPNAIDDENNVQNPQDSLIGDLKAIEDEQDQNDEPTVISFENLMQSSGDPGLIINQEKEEEEQTDSSDVDSIKSGDHTKLNTLINSLVPKGAIELVNELEGLFINRKAIKRNHEGLFSAVMTINSRMYEGQGVSKNSAQAAACEKALRDFFIEKMKAQGNGDSIMPQLASFAIHKLFEKWESDGIDCAALYTVDEHAPQSAVLPKKRIVRSTLPIDFKTMHPTLLLSYMRPKSSFKYLGSSGEPPNTLFTMGTKVDKQEFEATGTSKKRARLNVAVLACNTLFGTNLNPIR
nr:uncharacterized protein LOC108061886 [Drosophila takahashii]